MMGKKRAPRRCTYCGQLGHDRRNCPHLQVLKKLEQSAEEKPKEKTFEVVENIVALLNEAMSDVESSSMNAYGHPTLNVDNNGEIFVEETPVITGLMALGVCRFYLAKARGGNDGSNGV